jgi:hypothetical protein
VRDDQAAAIFRSAARDDAADARCLRDAAAILLARSKRQTLMLRVLARTLQVAARNIDHRVL